jgi:hypothetical protein
MPLNHPAVADLDDGAARVDGPRVLAAIDDAFERDAAIVSALCVARPSELQRRVRACARALRAGDAPGVTRRGRVHPLPGARMSLGCSWPTGPCRSRTHGSLWG